MKSISQLFSELYDQVLLNYQNDTNRSDRFPDLSANDEYYLNLLFELEDPTLTSFANKAKISKPAATRIIHRFIKAHYLTKHASSLDKRSFNLTLTDEMKKHCQQNDRLFDKVFLDAITPLSHKEQEQLAYLMNKIDQNSGLSHASKSD